ncbi:unnamed protein product [Heterobilharzia americana]|nr:unnamed protein product [Heterobilharzia americana]
MACPSTTETTNDIDGKQSVDAIEMDELYISNVEDEDIDLEHCRIKSISKLDRFPNVRHLCLRNNLLKKLENFEPVSQTLEDLDVYDNQISKIENLDCLTKLTNLDLSFNRIKSIENLDNLRNVKKLFLVNNRISKVENLSSMRNLEMLELGSNKIRKLENLEELTKLTQLYCGKIKYQHWKTWILWPI